jgi:predicted transposase YbfD/YdcC
LALAEVPDFRQAQGLRHSLAAVLALTCAAMLCGARGCKAVAEWGRNYDPELMKALGFTRLTPCPSTLHRLFRPLDWEQFEAALRAWAEGILAAPGAGQRDDAGAPGGLAIDGKTLRGSRKQGLPDAHVLSVVSHYLGLTLTHTAVPEKTNEIKAVQQVLRSVILEGRVVTVDALLTQREVAETIVAQGGDYVMAVKGNQPQLQSDIAAVFEAAPTPAEHRENAATHDLGHGRIEHRRLTTSNVLVGYSDWPGLAQVFRLERQVIRKKTGEVREETVYGVSSLPPNVASAARLLAYARGHWTIENRSHWVRDVTFDEDRSQVRCGNAPKVLAALRTAVISVLRLNGERNIAEATRRLAAQPRACLAYLGIEGEN